MRAGRSTCRAAQTAITVTRPRPSAHHAPHRVAPYPSLPLRSTGGHPGGRAGAPSGTAAKAGTWAVTEGEHSPTVSYTYLARTARYGTYGWASCAITQNGFVRIISQPRYPSPVPPALAIERLTRAATTEHHQFWPCSVTFLDGRAIRPEQIHGPRQVTDAYPKSGGCPDIATSASRRPSADKVSDRKNVLRDQVAARRPRGPARCRPRRQRDRGGAFIMGVHELRLPAGRRGRARRRAGRAIARARGKDGDPSVAAAAQLRRPAGHLRHDERLQPGRLPGGGQAELVEPGTAAEARPVFGRRHHVGAVAETGRRLHPQVGSGQRELASPLNRTATRTASPLSDLRRNRIKMLVSGGGASGDRTRNLRIKRMVIRFPGLSACADLSVSSSGCAPFARVPELPLADLLAVTWWLRSGRRSGASTEGPVLG
jgi:hypothetical protein